MMDSQRLYLLHNPPFRGRGRDPRHRSSCASTSCLPRATGLCRGLLGEVIRAGRRSRGGQKRLLESSVAPPTTHPHTVLLNHKSLTIVCNLPHPHPATSSSSPPVLQEPRGTLCIVRGYVLTMAARRTLRRTQKQKCGAGHHVPPPRAPHLTSPSSPRLASRLRESLNTKQIQTVKYEAG